MKSRFVFARAVAPAAIVLATIVAAPASAEPNMEKYGKSCAICHDMGVAGAPKAHDAAAWAPRLDKGTDALLASVKKGLKTMPATGLCADCTDDEYKELITYMSSPK